LQFEPDRRHRQSPQQGHGMSPAHLSRIIHRCRHSFRFAFGADLSVICLGTALASSLAGSSFVGSVDPRLPHLGLTLASAIVAGAIVIVGTMVTRTLTYPWLGWLGAGFALYAASAVSLSALGPLTLNANPGLLAALSIGNLAVITLLLVGWGQRRSTAARRPWTGAATAVAFAVILESAASRWPVVVNALTAHSVQIANALAWGAVAVIIGWEGYRKQDRSTWRIGVGLAVLAFAQSYRAVTGIPVSAPDPLFAGLQLVGLVGVLGGSARRLDGDVTSLMFERDQQRAELRESARHARRAAELAAERDHELANGLVGLSGIAFLLDRSADEVDGRALRSAVLTELSRLQAMLAEPAKAAPASYDAAGVVAEMALLRRAAGMDIEVRTEEKLPVNGRREVFAQVMTNLLVNCERHAPGSAVQVSAGRRDTEVVVEVRDAGPGIPAGTESMVLERGVTVGSTGGTGLGLDVSVRLLAAQGGSLQVLPRTPDRPGFGVRLALPVAE
jgi:two-component system OmpR family sensor kinase